MEENQGWIHLFRKFTNWEWYDNPNVKIVFLHCLLMANHKTGKWQGITIKRGQFISSYEKIASANGLSVQQVRTSIKKLKMTQEINTQTTNLYTLITVNNYGLYQSTLTDKQQSINKQITTNKNEKKREIINNLSLGEREILKNYLFELNQKRKNKIDDLDAYVRRLIENGDYLEKLEKAKKKLERQKAKVNIAPAEKIEKATTEDDKAGLELLRNTVKKIRKRG